MDVCLAKQWGFGVPAVDTQDKFLESKGVRLSRCKSVFNRRKQEFSIQLLKTFCDGFAARNGINSNLLVNRMYSYTR